MPRMAARVHARHPSTLARARAAALRTVVGAWVLGVGLPALSGPGAAHGTPVDRETVFLPAGEGRTLSAGPGGWTASTQITAAGCVPTGCPAFTAAWEPSIGVAGPGDGALRTRLAGLAGQSGTAVATWRSPVLLTPDTVDAASISAAIRRSGIGSTESVSSRLSIRLIPADGGPARTGVEAAAIGPSGGIWTSGPVGAFSPGALPLGLLHRIEVELRFQFDGRASGALDVDVDDVGLTLVVPRGDTFAPTAPGDPPADATPGDPPSDGATVDRLIAAVPLPGAAFAACRDEEIAVIGAAATAGRLTVVGGSSRPPGTAVTVQGPDGSRLGATTVDRHGVFRVAARESSAAPRARTVTARLPDGEASEPVAVQRVNVLRRVFPVRGRLAVEGTLSGSARRRAVTVRLQAATDGPCARPRPFVGASAEVDPRTGKYRAFVAPPTDSGVRAALATGGLLRAQVTTRSPGLPRRVTTSQAILVDPSVISTH